MSEMKGYSQEHISHLVEDKIYHCLTIQDVL